MYLMISCLMFMQYNFPIAKIKNNSNIKIFCDRFDQTFIYNKKKKRTRRTQYNIFITI